MQYYFFVVDFVNEVERVTGGRAEPGASGALHINRSGYNGRIPRGRLVHLSVSEVENRLYGICLYNLAVPIQSV
ncbi:MAG: hypothetical protein BMS9Abin33_0420 [Gammaproteobacteria bacterium]|nr:MAG: hypothetical protein BMS9Abin33_0420 [Gammaproteobacteria bacterium]